MKKPPFGNVFSLGTNQIWAHAREAKLDRCVHYYGSGLAAIDLDSATKFISAQFPDIQLSALRVRVAESLRRQGWRERSVWTKP